MEKYDSIPSLGEQRTTYRLFTFLVILSQLVAAGVTLMVGLWMGIYQGFSSWEDKTKIFSYHPLFMVIGLVFLYGHAILVYRIWRNNRKIYVKILHAVLHGLALLFASLGLKAVFDSHNYAKPNPANNLYSLHSWLGILTISLFAFQWLAGFLTFLLPFASQGLRACVKPLHVCGGIVIFLLVIATCLLGLTEKALFNEMSGKDKYTEYSAQGKLINAIGLMLIFLAMLFMFIVINPNYRRPPETEEEDRQALQLSH